MRLVHHQSDRPRPFRTCLEAMAQQPRLWVAAPYISVAILEELRPERIVTDVTEWLASEPNHAGCLAFIRKNAGVVRHRARLHAKVVLTKKWLLFGSANLTGSGLDTNEEFGAYLSDKDTVRQARGWFEAVWDLSAPVSEEDLARTIEAWRALGGPVRRQAPRFVGRTVASNPTQEQTERFVRSLSRFPSKDSARGYLSAVARLLAEFDLGAGDPRLSASVPRSSGVLLPVNVGSRRVVGYRHAPAGEVAIIVPAERVASTDSDASIAYVGHYQQRSAQDHRAAFVRLHSMTDLLKRNSSWHAAWLEAVGAQVELGHRADASSHNPAYLLSLLDERYRAEMINKAFRRKGGSSRVANSVAPTELTP